MFPTPTQPIGGEELSPLLPTARGSLLGSERPSRFALLRQDGKSDSHPGHTARIDSVALHPIHSIARHRRMRRPPASLGSHHGSYASRNMQRHRTREFRLLIVRMDDSSLRLPSSVSNRAILRSDAGTRQAARRFGDWTITRYNQENWRHHPTEKSSVPLATLLGFSWRAKTGKPIRTLDGIGESTFFHNGWGGLAELGFIPDGSQLLAWGYKNGIHRWEIATGVHQVQACDTLDQTPLCCCLLSRSKTPDNRRRC